MYGRYLKPLAKALKREFEKQGQKFTYLLIQVQIHCISKQHEFKEMTQDLTKAAVTSQLKFEYF